jgi:hypothetical protein
LVTRHTLIVSERLGNNGEGKKERPINLKSGWFVLSLVLAVCLVVSLSVNVYQHFVITEGAMPKSYVFYFYNDYIRNDTAVRIEVTFDWQVENLSMTVTVNDDEFNEWDYVGVVFDKNENGIIDFRCVDEPYAFFAPNLTFSGYMRAFLGGWGGLSWVIMRPDPSKYHTCTFNEETGYTFKISLPRQEIKVEPPTPIHICFVDYERPARLSEVTVWAQLQVP